jgi:hypothetical protein
VREGSGGDWVWVAAGRPWASTVPPPLHPRCSLAAPICAGEETSGLGGQPGRL